MPIDDHDKVDEFDLAQFDDGFEHAEVEDREYAPLPDGRYQVRVEKAELTRSREKQTPMIKWTLRVLGPTNEGRCTWKYSMLRDESLGYVKTDLHLCGVGLQKLSDLPSRLTDLLDVTLDVSLKTKGDIQSVYFNRRIEIENGRTAYDAAATDARAQF